jgi:transposase InsO family protein
MSIRRAIVEVDRGGLNVTEFCRTHGVSTWFFYDLRRRWVREGDAVLEAKSRAPHAVRNRTPECVEELIVGLRKELGSDGLDAGPATIRYHLAGRLPAAVIAPSEATIWRVLSRRGFVVPEPKKAPKHAHRSFTAERANECWQVDDTEWALADETRVKIINVVDDCTRVAVGSRAMSSCTADAVLEAFLIAGDRWGLPERSLSDNAKAYRHGVAEALAALGIAPGHSRPYHPQTCGKVERFHQTLKRSLAAHPRAETLVELQHQIDRFVGLYNHARPHRSLGRQIPAEVFAATPKSGPAHRPLGASTSVHHGTVTVGGRITIGNNRYRISVGAAYTGQRAVVVITEPACHVFVDGHLVRQFALDPNRLDQPLYPRGGPNAVRKAPRHA